MGELTGTLAERLSPPLSGNEDSRVTAEITSPTEIIVRVVEDGSGLDLFAMYSTLHPLMDRLGKTMNLINGFEFTAVPVFGGFSFPPPSPPPPLPPLDPQMEKSNASETESGVEKESSGSGAGGALLALGIIFLLIAGPPARRARGPPPPPTHTHTHTLTHTHTHTHARTSRHCPPPAHLPPAPSSPCLRLHRRLPVQPLTPY
jgi:hypothetical protein